MAPPKKLSLAMKNEEGTDDFPVPPGYQLAAGEVTEVEDLEIKDKGGRHKRNRSGEFLEVEGRAEIHRLGRRPKEPTEILATADGGASSYFRWKRKKAEDSRALKDAEDQAEGSAVSQQVSSQRKESELRKYICALCGLGHSRRTSIFDSHFNSCIERLGGNPNHLRWDEHPSCWQRGKPSGKIPPGMLRLMKRFGNIQQASDYRAHIVSDLEDQSVTTEPGHGGTVKASRVKRVAHKVTAEQEDDESQSVVVMRDTKSNGKQVLESIEKDDVRGKQDRHILELHDSLFLGDHLGYEKTDLTNFEASDFGDLHPIIPPNQLHESAHLEEVNWSNFANPDHNLDNFWNIYDTTMNWEEADERDPGSPDVNRLTAELREGENLAQQFPLYHGNANPDLLAASLQASEKSREAGEIDFGDVDFDYLGAMYDADKNLGEANGLDFGGFDVDPQGAKLGEDENVDKHVLESDCGDFGPDFFANFAEGLTTASFYASGDLGEDQPVLPYLSASFTPNQIENPGVSAHPAGLTGFNPHLTHQPLPSLEGATPEDSSENTIPMAPNQVARPYGFNGQPGYQFNPLLEGGREATAPMAQNDVAPSSRLHAQHRGQHQLASGRNVKSPPAFLQPSTYAVKTNDGEESTAQEAHKAPSDKYKSTQIALPPLEPKAKTEKHTAKFFTDLNPRLFQDKTQGNKPKEASDNPMPLGSGGVINASLRLQAVMDGRIPDMASPETLRRRKFFESLLSAQKPYISPYPQVTPSMPNLSQVAPTTPLAARPTTTLGAPFSYVSPRTVATRNATEATTPDTRHDDVQATEATPDTQGDSGNANVLTMKKKDRDAMRKYLSGPGD